MMNFLGKITESKIKEVELLKERFSVKDFERDELFSRKTISLSASIKKPAGTGIIAEFKRKSPSKGVINMHSAVELVAKGYEAGGAAALSILTESRFFGGTPGDLISVRAVTDLPILRKDFIIDEFQIYESKFYGADAILLIAAILDRKKVTEFARIAREIYMEVILEIHSPGEIEMINEYVNIVGINNRNLDTLEVDVSTSFRLIEKIPDDFVKISESGISSPKMIAELRKAGFDGFLIGEHFMSKPYPAAAFRDFVIAVSEKLKDND